MSLSLKSADGAYILQNSKGESLALSPTETAELVRIARSIRDLLKQQSHGSQLVPMSTSPLREMRLTVDAHQTQVVFHLVDEDRMEFGGTATLDSAISLRDRLIPEFDSQDSWMAEQAVIPSPSGGLIREDSDERGDCFAGGLWLCGVASAGLRHAERQSGTASVGVGCGLRWHGAR